MATSVSCSRVAASSRSRSTRISWNSSFADLLGGIEGGLEKENDARAWLLLEHLRLWREWNQTPDHRFYNKVDLHHIALIGHSRGGEAVAIAALFNRLPFYPDDGRVVFDYGFDLRGVIAIAPSDAQYKPRERPTPIRNVSYLVIHGSEDGDVQSFMVAQNTPVWASMTAPVASKPVCTPCRCKPWAIQHRLGPQRSRPCMGFVVESCSDHGRGGAAACRRGHVRCIPRHRAARPRRISALRRKPRDRNGLVSSRHPFPEPIRSCR